MEWDSNTVAVALAALLAISEVIALIPGMKSNSVFQLIMRLMRTFKTKK